MVGALTAEPARASACRLYLLPVGAPLGYCVTAGEMAVAVIWTPSAPGASAWALVAVVSVVRIPAWGAKVYTGGDCG
mgnify:CR=1 FL=1